jgi:hypothetical protein
MMTRTNLLFVLISIVILLCCSCTNQEQTKHDVVNETFPEAQAELQVVLEQIYDDAMLANVEGLETIHLVSPKFTKFGPRSFNRQTVEETNESEASFFTSISDLKVELKDIKIDVFGDVAITTFYPHYSLVKDV